MRLQSPAWRETRRLGVRTSIFVVLTYTMTMSMTALHAADGAAAAELMDMIVVLQDGPFAFSLLDPFLIIILLWCIAPAFRVVSLAWRDIRGPEVIEG